MLSITHFTPRRTICMQHSSRSQVPRSGVDIILGPLKLTHGKQKRETEIFETKTFQLSQKSMNIKGLASFQWQPMRK